ncbi:MAG: AAA domain-containing protein [Gemmatimonadetes bacterium]|nr:AAA domain-containing protein [Gemmatimonadota bacterium]NIO31501.1 AAA domain-containing protein [Gemmatimonadota bacterium]
MLVRVLLLVESAALRRRLTRLLRSTDVLVSPVLQPDEFWAQMGRESCDLVLATRAALPQVLPEAVSTLHGLPERPELIVVVDREDPEDRASLLAAGVMAVIYHGLPDATVREALGALVGRRRETLRRGVRAQQAETRSRLSDFVSNSLVMQRLLALASRVAEADTSLLIVGETGVGKEWLARAIHTESRRSEAPFVAVNCAALPEGLLESELFGHEKGSFTGALRSRRGYFELAHGGTLFLDEIAEMAPPLQAKLLRGLQERKIQRVGSEELIAVDVRIIAASNRDLEAVIEAGELRRDLYYRLGVVTLTLPPLRERREDIADLVNNYVKQFRVQLGRPVAGISPEALEALEHYVWPGNVRELVNVIERAVLLCKSTELTVDDLPESVVASTGWTQTPQATARRSMKWLAGDELLSKPLGVARGELVTSFERAYLIRALRSTGGRVGEAARRAGIDPRTLYNKMKLYGLQKEEYKS